MCGYFVINLDTNRVLLCAEEYISIPVAVVLATSLAVMVAMISCTVSLSFSRQTTTDPSLSSTSYSLWVNCTVRSTKGNSFMYFYYFM